MKKLYWGAWVGMSLWAASAHAAISQVPALPAQVSLTFSAVNDDGDLLLAPHATGSASIQGGSWVAAVTSVTTTEIHLGEGAGIQFFSGLPALSTKVPTYTWSDLTIHLDSKTITADRYEAGIKKSDDVAILSLGGFEGGTDSPMPGQSNVWRDTASMCELANPCSYFTVWLPMQLGTVTVSSVPEPAAALTSVLGLLAVAGARRQRARQLTR